MLKSLIVGNVFLWVISTTVMLAWAPPPHPVPVVQQFDEQEIIKTMGRPKMQTPSPDGRGKLFWWVVRPEGQCLVIIVDTHGAEVLSHYQLPCNLFPILLRENRKDL